MAGNTSNVINISDISKLKDIWIIFSADYHIRPKARVWKHKAEPSGDIILAISQIVELCNTLKPEFLVLAGDIFDSVRNIPNCVEIFSLLDNIDTSIAKLYIQGQHELSTPPWIFVLKRYRSDYIHLHNNTIQSARTKLKLFGWDYDVSLSNVLSSFYGDIFITHQVISDFVPSGHVCIRDFANFQYVISGDYHKAIVKEMIPNSFKYFISPGNIAPNNINEFGASSVFCMDTSMNIYRVDLACRPFHSFGVFDDDSLEETLEELKTITTTTLRPLIKFSCHSKFVSTLRKAASNFYTYFDIHYETEPIKPLPQNDNLVTSFVEYFKTNYPEYSDSFNVFLDCLLNTQRRNAALELTLSTLEKSFIASKRSRNADI